MSVFLNITGADLYLQTPEGGRRIVKIDVEFTASNFYKRYTSEEATSNDFILLRLLEDDGLPYSTESGELRVPNFLRSWEFTVEPGEDWVDHTLDFTSSNLLGAPAQFLQMLVDDAPVEVRINGDDRSDFRMDADSTQVFNTNELLVGAVAFKNPVVSGGLPAVVRVLAATVSVV